MASQSLPARSSEPTSSPMDASASAGRVASSVTSRSVPSHSSRARACRTNGAPEANAAASSSLAWGRAARGPSSTIPPSASACASSTSATASSSSAVPSQRADSSRKVSQSIRVPITYRWSSTDWSSFSAAAATSSRNGGRKPATWSGSSRRDGVPLARLETIVRNIFTTVSWPAAKPARSASSREAHATYSGVRRSIMRSMLRRRRS
ncbi:hypothetical protein [Sinomonas atrocyanea]